MQNSKTFSLNSIKQNENLIESFDQVDLSTTTTTSSAIASLPKNEDKSFINQNITLKFLDSTWIQLRDNQENIIFSKFEYKGHRF